MTIAEINKMTLAEVNQLPIEELRKLPKKPKAAKALGSTYYFPDKPCENGHLTARSVSSRTCRVCHDDYVKSPKGKAAIAKYRASPKAKQWQENYKETKRHSERERHLKKTYQGMTVLDFVIMLMKQKCRCAINPEHVLQAKFVVRIDAKGRVTMNHNGQVNVDHNKVTGKVRGLLCGPCNRMIGLAQHDPKTLRSAADYIEKHDGK